MNFEEELGYYFLFAFVMTIMYWHYIAIFITILILLGLFTKHLKKKKKNGQI